MGTAPPGGAFFVVGSALAEVVNETGATEGFNVTAEATSGSQENIRRLATGELDFALSNAAITYFAVAGNGGLGPRVSGPVRDDAGPERRAVHHLGWLRHRGARPTWSASGSRSGPAGAGFEYFVGPLLQAHGITYDDFTPLNATQQAAVDMLTDGSSDAAFLGGAVPTASITQAAASMDIVFLPFGESEKQQLVDEYPVLPTGHDSGRHVSQPGRGAFDGLDVGSMHLITSADPR